MKQIFDQTAALQRLRGDVTLLRDMAVLFVTDSEEALRELRGQVASGNWQSARESAHRFKGAVGNFLAAESEDAARTLERTARSGDAVAAPIAFEKFEQALLRLRAALNEFIRTV